MRVSCPSDRTKYSKFAVKLQTTYVWVNDKFTNIYASDCNVNEGMNPEKINSAYAFDLPKSPD